MRFRNFTDELSPREVIKNIATSNGTIDVKLVEVEDYK
jgi:hypothetical protein